VSYADGQVTATAIRPPSHPGENLSRFPSDCSQVAMDLAGQLLIGRPSHQGSLKLTSQAASAHSSQNTPILLYHLDSCEPNSAIGIRKVHLIPLAELKCMSPKRAVQLAGQLGESPQIRHSNGTGSGTSQPRLRDHHHGYIFKWLDRSLLSRQQPLNRLFKFLTNS
jgi:hypothetical protein